MKNRFARSAGVRPGFILLALAVFTFLFVPPASGAPVPLYNGSLGALPTSQFWLYGVDPAASTIPVMQNGAVVMDSTGPTADSAGFFTITSQHPAFLQPLDREAGFTVWVEAQLISESHVSDDRAGYSVIVLSNDLSGIELGFWDNEIWAQEFVDGDTSQQFIHAEGTDATPTVAQTPYAIWIRGDSYRLYVDGDFRLTGPVRNYSPFGAPYNQANFIFFGDNTSSAEAVSATAGVAVNIHAPGDLNDSGEVTLLDALIALQVLAGLSPAELDPEWAIAGGDVDGDFQAGLAEAIYALQWSAEVRP